MNLAGLAMVAVYSWLNLRPDMLAAAQTPSAWPSGALSGAGMPYDTFDTMPARALDVPGGVIRWAVASDRIPWAAFRQCSA